jgi:Zn-finger nucleic acid-binding protein
MKCPVCANLALAAFELQPNVTAQKCAACAGLWLGSPAFANWIDSIQTGTASGATDLAAPAPTPEPKTAKICPECGYLMTRYKVGHALSFSLDRCGHCGGTWFDGNEWETLKGSELWNQVHLIFSPAWQNRVRHAEQAEQLRAQFAAKLGPLDFAETERIKAWLNNHPHRAAILAHLASEKD